MPQTPLVLAPGPVQLHPKVQAALALPMIHHRTPEFDRIFQETLLKLQAIFQTKQPVFALTATGSGGMEAALVNVLSPGDAVLGIDSGKFGERWCEMVQTFGGKLHRLKTEWGQAVSPAAVEAALRAHPEIKLVLCQACETSTGVQHPISELAKITAQNDCLLLVDAITALGAYHLPMDAWGIDVLIGGSQKAFMLPAGMTFLSFSQKAWKKVESARTPRFYFDVRKELVANRKGESYFSGNVTLIRALSVALDIMLDAGLPAWFQQIEQRANFVRTTLARLKLPLYPQNPAPSLTAVRTPVDSVKLRELMESRYGVTVMGGQDQLRGKILRVGHMGHITGAHLWQLMLALQGALSDMSSLPIAKTDPFWTELEKSCAQF